jgi:hypothetical protein
MEREMESRIPSIIDLNAQLAKLTMFHGLTPTTTREERRGSEESEHADNRAVAQERHPEIGAYPTGSPVGRCRGANPHVVIGQEFHTDILEGALE